MAAYTDTEVNMTEGFGDTNVNVFTFGFVPLNDVFGYGGVKKFLDKKSLDALSDFSRASVIAATTFTKDSVDSTTVFVNNKGSESTNFTNETTDGSN